MNDAFYREMNCVRELSRCDSYNKDALFIHIIKEEIQIRYESQKYEIHMQNIS